ncbi:hypothetical protein ACIGCP_17555 [Cellulophaga baltica]|uniref:hypothetical protein n=1 Tax=Cellulophaga baltica TaxID=76594 RepID=UPI0037CC64AD
MKYSSKKHILLSANMLPSYLGVILFFVVVTDIIKSNEFNLGHCFFLLVPPSCFICLGAHFSNYVEIDQKKITIKNPIFFLKKKTYTLDKIMYISVNRKWGGRGYFDGIEIHLRKKEKEKTYYLAFSSVDEFNGDPYLILENELKKVNIKLVDNRTWPF